jgi:hypothetical protein
VRSNERKARYNLVISLTVLARIPDMDPQKPQSEPPRSESGLGSSLPAQEILGAIDRLRSSRTFAHSHRLLELLGFLVAATLDGSGPSLSETAIGVALYHRDQNYDTGRDGIVRIQAKRLRDRLLEFYRGEGAGESIVIHLDQVGYGLLVEKRTSSDGASA